MTFVKEYYRTLVPDWHNYYINLNYLNEELVRIRKLVHEIHFRRDIAPEPGPALMPKEFALRKLQKDFAFIFEGEIIKFCGFFKLNFTQTIKPKLVQLRLNVHHYKLIADARKKRKAYYSIKRALLMYYKELHLFNGYIESNLECVETLCNIYKQIFVGIESYDPSIVAKIYVSLRQSFPVVTKPELERITKAVANTYMEFCVKETRDEQRQDLQAVANQRRLNSAQLVLTGIFVGVFALACCIVVFLLHEVRFFSSAESPFARYSFPMFRGTLMAFLYLLSLGVCVYVWDRYNINYKRPFEIAEGHMRPYEIFKLGFGFLCLWVILFIYCGFAALEHKKGSFDAFFRPAVANWLPPCLYVAVALYAVFPSSRLLNADMRLYVARTFAQLVYFPVRTLSFKEKFLISQLTTFKPFFRDMGYAVCYAQTLLHTGRQANSCELSRPYLYFESFLNLAPLVVSTTQSLRGLLLEKKPTPLKIYGLFALLLTLFSSLKPQTPRDSLGLQALFYALLLLNTLFSYVDDVKFDWKFLQKSSVYPLLRDVLALPHLSFYYFALVANLFLRSYWTINLLPLSSFQNLVVQNYIALGAVFAETLRRTVANIIRVEVLHWEGVGNFNVVQRLPLPFFNALEEVRAREEFEREYKQALFLGDYYELERENGQLSDVRPYENLDHSFTEEELKDFAKKRTLQLIKKNEKVGKVLQRMNRRPPVPLPQSAEGRRSSLHKWNDDLSLNVTSMFALQRQKSLRTQRAASLNRTLPLDLREDSAVEDVESGPLDSASRLRAIAPINQVRPKQLELKVTE